VSTDSLKDMKFLKSLLNKILIYKLVESKKIFDNEFYKERPHMNSNNAIAIFINILNCATTRLQQVFS
jgi:C4-dicarboxylate transporter